MCILRLSIVTGEEVKDGRRESLSVYFENDMFSDTDRYYTNGMRISWLSPDIRFSELPDWAGKVYELLPFLLDRHNLSNLGFALGHSIYTPEDTDSPNLIKDDVPYAGWLYLGVALQSRNQKELHNLELSLGIVGPSALGEQAQNTVHRLRKQKKARGWEHQLHDEPAVSLNYEYKRRWRRQSMRGNLGWDIIPHLRLTAGNVHTYAETGFSLRAGLRLPRDFQSSRNRLSSYILSPAAEESGLQNPRISLFVFTTISGRGVLRNIFLDGNTFRDSHRVKRIPWVSELEFGVGICRGRYTLMASHVRRSREFKGQENSHQFGSISMAVAF